MLSNKEKNDLIYKSKYDLHLIGNTFVSENTFKETIIKNDYDFDLNHVSFNTNYFLIETISKICIMYNNVNDLNNMISLINDLKNKNITKKDFSNCKGHINGYDCINKCINNYGSNNCKDCNYYKDMLLEHEIDQFNINQEKKLNNYLNWLENRD